MLRPPLASPVKVSPGNARGFTLLEVLVVVTIIGILTALLVPNIGSAGRWRDLQREANTLAARIRVAQDDAMLYGREYGIVFSEDGYRFVAWDAGQGGFVDPAPSANWMLRQLDDDIRLAASADSKDPLLVLPETDENATPATTPAVDAVLTGEAAPAQQEKVTLYQPSVYVLSSGEVTPFTAELRADGEDQAVQLRIDPLGNRLRDEDEEGGDRAPAG